MAKMFANICNNPLGPSIMAILGLTAIMERKKSEEEEYKGVLEAKLRLSCLLPLLLLLAPPRTTALNIAQSGFHSQAKKYMPKTRLEYDA